MSILVEIAEKADVSVEGVVRVLTREPVSDAIKERVLAVLEDLDPEQTRAVQRFALAALHDVLPRPLEAREPVDELPFDEPLPELQASTETVPEQFPVPLPDAPLVQLSSVLGELADAVRDLRRETDAERRERVDDLAVMIDLITTGWQGLDARLGRLERQLSRLEPGLRQPVAARPLLVEPAPVAPVDAEPARIEPARVEPARVEPTPPETPSPPPAAASATVVDFRKRHRLPLAAALTMVGVVIGTLAVLQLVSAGPDVTGLVSARETPSESAERDTTTTAPATTAARTTGASATTSTRTGAATTGAATTGAATTRPRPPASQPSATTSSVLGTSAGETRPKPPAPKPAPVQPVTTAPVKTAAAPAGFRPTRNWAWAPVEGADYYSVDFLRGGESFYRATTPAARLTLPNSVVFRPGSYRWVVRPGFGKRSANNLGLPVVDSPFTVAG